MTQRQGGMDSVRRIYLYVMTAIALVFIAIGASNLLQILVVGILESVSDQTWSPIGSDWERRRLSLALPFLAIAIPVWFVHWRMIERSLGGEDAAVERDSTARGLFLFVVLAATLYTLAVAAITTIELGLREVFGLPMDRFQREEFAFALPQVIVIAAIWLFHLLILRRDAATGPIVERGPLLPQAVLHFSAGAGLLLAMFGVARMLDVIHTATLGDAPAGRWWHVELATAIAMLVTGLVAWGATSLVTERLLAGTAWWGRSDQESRLRHAVWGIFLFAFALFVMLGLAEAIEAIVQRGSDAEDVIKPIGFMAPFIAGWAYFRWRLLAEPQARAGSIQPIARRRLNDYSLALLGLGWLASGLVLLLTKLVAGIGGVTVDRDELAWPIAMLMTGIVLWGWHWLAISRRLGRDPETEQASTIRRGYLLTVIGASIVALLIGLTTTAYQLLQRILDVDNLGSLAADIDWPLALAISGLLAGAGHGLLLRRDLAVRPLTSRVEARNRLVLVLTGPTAADLREVVTFLRQELPEGYDLDIEGHGQPGRPPVPASHAEPATGARRPVEMT